MRRCLVVTTFCLSLVPAPLARGEEWTSVAPGIDYQELTLPGPIRVYIARADRSMKNWVVDGMLAEGTAKGGRETVPDMVKRHDDSVNADGERYSIKIAINGDYFNMTSGASLGGEVIAGSFVRRHGEYGGGSAFVWTSDRRCVMGGNVRQLSLQHVVFADGARMSIDVLNDAKVEDNLALYTHHYAENTGTASDRTEVLVRLSGPLALYAPNRGEIVQVRRQGGSTALPYEHAVLSARGKAAEELLKHVKAGQAVRFDMGLQDYGIDVISLPPQDWHNAYGSIAAPKVIVVKRKVPHEWWEKKAAKQIAAGGKSGAVVADPRTAIAYNEKYLYFIVIDGRSTESRGMTFTDTGNFCVETLKADYACLQDGGGSSTMWVDGKVRNHPSGKPNVDEPGVLRAVSNGYMIALVNAPTRSQRFTTGARVAAGGEVKLRLGPGTQYGVAATIPAGAAGSIQKQRLGGILAKGRNWWPCRFGTAEGWAPEEELSARAK